MSNTVLAAHTATQTKEAPSRLTSLLDSRRAASGHTGKITQQLQTLRSGYPVDHCRHHHQLMALGVTSTTSQDAQSGASSGQQCNTSITPSQWHNPVAQ
jgi:hypothetical protein